MFEALSGCPSEDLPHALRWYNHIASFGAEKATFPGSKKDLDSYGAGPVTNGTKNDDDDFDLFGSDEEEVVYIIFRPQIVPHFFFRVSRVEKHLSM